MRGAGCGVAIMVRNSHLASRKSQEQEVKAFRGWEEAVAAAVAPDQLFLL